MEFGQTNLFLGDHTYRQSYSLKFREISTEQKYTYECAKLYSRSNTFLWIWFIINWFLFSFLAFSLMACMISSLFLILSYNFIGLIAKITIFQIYFTIWVIYSLKELTIIECIGIYIPSLIFNFYLLNSWTILFSIHICQAIMFYLQTNTNPFNLFLSIIIITLIKYAIEKDYRDMWHLYSSYKKSDCIHKNLWTNSPNASFLVNSQGCIILANNAADNIIEPCLEKGFAKGINKIESVFNSKWKTFRKVLDKIMKRQNINEEIIKQKLINKIRAEDMNDIGYLIKSDTIPWNSDNSIRIIFIDISTHITKKLILIHCCKGIDSNLKILYKNIFYCLLQNMTFSCVPLTLFHTMHYKFRDTMLLQSLFYNKIDIRQEHFDPHSEVQNIIEMAFLKICDLKLSLNYTKEKGIPSSVIGDKYLHNQALHSILDLVLDNALENSDIQILIQVSVIFK